MATGNRAQAFLSLDDQTKAGFASFKRSLGEAGGLLGGFKAQLAGVLSVGAGTAFLASTVRQLDELADAAERTGRSASELSQLQFAFKITGASAEDVGKAMRALSQELSKAKQGSKEQAELFKVLDIDVSGLEDATDALDALAEAFPKLSDLDRLRVARELLGKGGEALVPALKDGPAALRALREEAALLQPGIEAAAKASNEFGDAIDRASLTIRGSLLPSLTEGLKGLTEWVTRFRDAVKISGGFVAALNDIRVQNPFATTAEELGKIRREIELTIQRIGEFSDAGIDTTKLEEGVSRLVRQRTYLQQQQAREALEGRTGPEFMDARDRALRVQRGVEGGRLRLPSEAGAGGNAALKKAMDERERLRQADIQGWVRYADAVFEAADEENQALAKSAEQFFAEQERLRQEDIKGWIAYADAVFEAADEENLALAKIADEAQKTNDVARELGLTFESAFENAVIKGESFSDVLKGIEDDLLRLGTRKLVTEPLLGKFEEILKGGGGGGGGEGGFLDAIVGGVGKFFGGFATGGSFMVGGGGGTDSQLVAFRATPGERVTVSTPGQGAGGGTVNVVNNFNGFSGDTRSQQQIAAEVGRSVSRATRRNT